MSITPIQQRRSRSAGNRSASLALRRLAPVAVIAAAVAVTGCQLSDTSSSTSTTGAASSSTTASQTSSTTSTPARVRHLTTWESPTGDVVCRVERRSNPAQVACQKVTPAYPRQTERYTTKCRDADNPTNTARLASGRPTSWSCVGEYWGGPGVPILQYGEAVKVGPLTCESDRTGMTCWEKGQHTAFSFRRAHDEPR